MSEKTINLKGLIGIYSFLITGSALNMTSGILAYIMMTYSEVSPTNVALIMTIPAAVGTFFAFVSGSVLNRVGVRKLTLFCHTSQFLSGMIYLFFGNKTHIAVLYAAAALYGFLLGGYAVIQAQAFKDFVPDETVRGRFLGYATSMRSLGGVVMSTVGGMIAAVNSGAHWERAFLLYFVMVLCIIIEYFTLPEGKPVKAVPEKAEATGTKEKLPLKVWLISLHYLWFFLFLYVFSLNISEYVITTHSLGTSTQAGFCLSFLTIGGIISGVFYGRYSAVLKTWTMPVLLALCSLGLAIVVFIPNMIMLYIASFLMGMAMMGTSPYITIELSRICSGKTYTRAMSIYSGFTNGGMMFAVYILAFLAMVFVGDANSVDGKFLIAFIGNLLVTVTAIPLFVRRKNEA